MSNPTRASLLSRMRDPDDHHAWQEFDAQYHDLILRYCTRRGLQLTDAEDVRQTVMLNLHRGMSGFQYSPNRGRFRDYLGRTVVHAIAEFFRRQKPASLGVGGGGELPQDVDEGLDEAWEREWVLHHYRRALREVRNRAAPRSLEVFGRLIAGQSVERIMRELELDANTVYKTKQRLRERLSEQIRQQLAEEQLPSKRRTGPSAVTP